MGDFNAQTGIRKQGEENILGMHCQGRRTRNGEKLVNLALENQLVILNTYFKKRQNNRWTWVSPDGEHRNEIDFILTNRQKCFDDCGVICNLNFNTNHRMVRANMKDTPPKSRRIHQNKPDHVNQLRNQLSADELKEEIKLIQASQLENNNVTEICRNIENVINKCKRANSKTKKGTEILSEHTKKLKEERASLIEIKPKTKEIRKTITEISKQLRTNIRKDRHNHRIETLERLIAKTGGTKRATKILQEKEEWIPKLKDSSGQDKTKRPDIINVATEYYKNLYAKATPGKEIELPDTSIVPYILKREVEAAIKSQKRDKTPGPDGIRNETLLEIKDYIVPTLTDVFNKILTTETIPQQWTASTISLLHKKGSKHDISNYRPISLMSNLYKVFAKIILSRITRILDENQPREQAGFRSNYSTVDHIHVVTQIFEKCKEYNITFYCCFIDYCKAFDSIEHSRIWEALKNQGVEHKYIRIMKNIYTGTTAKIKLEREGESIPIQRGVRQGDPLSPKLFSAVLEEVFRDIDWNNSGLNINSEKLTHLRFADDIVIFASTSEELQQMLGDLDIASKSVGLEMNKEKTKAMTNGDSSIEIKVSNNSINYVTEYIYLGQLISPNESTTKEIDRRIANAWKRYWSMKEVMKNKQMSIAIKSKLFDNCILPILTYGCQTWALTKALTKKLEVGQRAMERSMINKRRIDRMRNSDLRRKTKVANVTYKVKKLK
ncbi:hypothetical protein O0L34_g7995 [Tuta absoluta]|nr:hypothetical protein O0L34_g7995 [Tuta absoluta]